MKYIFAAFSLVCVNLAYADTHLANVVARVLPSVVNIRITYPLEGQNGFDIDSLHQKSLDQFFELFLLPGKIVNGNQSRASGSGFFYDTKGTIVTNHHVIEGAKRIEIISTASRRPVEAVLVGVDVKADIAILKAKISSQSTPVRFVDSISARIGEDVFAIGNPFGYGHTVTRGIISSKNRSIGAGPLDDFLQTDAAINPGNSGGPLFNSDGFVIGINKATSAQGHGISFAIPSELALPAIRRILGDIKNTQVWLGLVATNVSDDQSIPGVFVQNLIRNSPAVKSGVQVGDVILRVNSTPTRNVVDLKKSIPIFNDTKGRVRLHIFRQGKKLDIDVKGALMAQEVSALGATF